MLDIARFKLPSRRIACVTMDAYEAPVPEPRKASRVRSCPIGLVGWLQEPWEYRPSRTCKPIRATGNAQNIVADFR